MLSSLSTKSIRPSQQAILVLRLDKILVTNVCWDRYEANLVQVQAIRDDARGSL